MVTAGGGGLEIGAWAIAGIGGRKVVDEVAEGRYLTIVLQNAYGTFLSEIEIVEAPPPP
jgi:hypothetical protein